MIYLKSGEKFRSFLFVAYVLDFTTYDLNSKRLVRYYSHVLNNKLIVCYSSHDLNNEPFKERTVLNHSNTELVCYSDPHCI